MTNIASRSALVGGFILGGLGLAVVAVLLFGGMSLLSTTTTAVVFFEGSVAGLQIGAPVTFRGVRVGEVRSIALRVNLADLTAAIPVTIDLEEKNVSAMSGSLSSGPIPLPRLIGAGLRAQLATQSLVTGQLVVNLDLQPGTPAHLAGGGGSVIEIPALPSDLQKLKDQVSQLPLRDLADSAARTLKALEILSGKLDTQVGPTLDSLRATSDAARITLDTSTQAVLAMQAEISRTLHGVDQLVSNGQRQLDGSGADLHRTLVAAERAASHAGALAKTIGDMVEPRGAMRADLEAALRDLAASAGSLRGFAAEIERNPGAIVTGRGGR